MSAATKRKMAIWVFYVGMLLLHAPLMSNGGTTSSFKRKEEKGRDMPLDSDVFQVPKGYNAPQQVIFFLNLQSFLGG